MLSLNKSNKYQSEISDFEIRISKIKVATNKSKALSMLNEIKSHVHYINEGHGSWNDGNIDPVSLRENVSELQRLRYTLDVFLKSA